ncbi:hypothetical protein EV182_000359 [Spiromyces aspiralis]|uniref:Uncharacterized protein n=1 Tax=Spiromyces aspiralis TaxID=68401 RepID=A0ACC1HHQ5_9FUNG|nr:hypothetical protein EV182_000359 [Spiromyces aspiralis]
MAIAYPESDNLDNTLSPISPLVASGPQHAPSVPAASISKSSAGKQPVRPRATRRNNTSNRSKTDSNPRRALRRPNIAKPKKAANSAKDGQIGGSNSSDGGGGDDDEREEEGIDDDDNYNDDDDDDERDDDGEKANDGGSDGEEGENGNRRQGKGRLRSQGLASNNDEELAKKRAHNKDSAARLRKKRKEQELKLKTQYVDLEHRVSALKMALKRQIDRALEKQAKYPLELSPLGDEHFIDIDEDEDADNSDAAHERTCRVVHGEDPKKVMDICEKVEDLSYLNRQMIENIRILRDEVNSILLRNKS